MSKTTIEFAGGMRFEGRGGSGHKVVMDASAKSGGADEAARPVETFLCALGACTGMDVIAILRKMKSPLEALTIQIDDERAEDYPQVFTAIHLTYRIRGRIPRDRVVKAVDLSLSKYCPIANSLAGVAEITSEIVIEPG